MSPSLPLPKGDVPCTTVANDAQHPNSSLAYRMGEPQSSWTTPPRRPGGNSHDTVVSQTPDNGRIWTPLVHISGGGKEPGQRLVSKSLTIRHNAAMFHTSPDAIEGLHDGVNKPSNPFNGALQSTTGSPPSYAALHDITDDGKTMGCNRTLTFDTIVEPVQLNGGNPSEKEKVERSYRDRFRKWMRKSR